MSEKDLQRFFTKVKKTRTCWNWTKSLWKGYGVFWLVDRTYMAHRVAYEHWKGKIPVGLTIDHLCRNHQCVNPKHLEAVSFRTNVLRGESFAAIHAKKTECKRGHLFTAENTLRDGNNRRCKICQWDKWYLIEENRNG
jgi:hypothetical protein